MSPRPWIQRRPQGNHQRTPSRKPPSKDPPMSSSPPWETHRLLLNCLHCHRIPDKEPEAIDVFIADMWYVLMSSTPPEWNAKFETHRCQEKPVSSSQNPSMSSSLPPKAIDVFYDPVKSRVVFNAPMQSRVAIWKPLMSSPLSSTPPWSPTLSSSSPSQLGNVFIRLFFGWLSSIVLFFQIRRVS